MLSALGLSDVLLGSTQFLVFLGICALGTLPMLIAVVVGEIFEMIGGALGGVFDIFHIDFLDTPEGGPSSGAFGFKCIAVFFAIFGAVGATLTLNGFGPGLSTLLSAFSALVVASIYLLSARYIYSQQTNSVTAERSLVGRKGLLSTGIGEGGRGEVLISGSGPTITKTARSNSGPIKSGTPVTIVSTAGPIVIVEPSTN